MAKQIKNPFMIVLGVLVINFLGLFSETALNIALPNIGQKLSREFRANAVANSWLHHGNRHCATVNNIDFTVGEGKSHFSLFSSGVYSWVRYSGISTQFYLVIHWPDDSRCQHWIIHAAVVCGDNLSLSQ
jgi:hypothetical protein